MIITLPKWESSTSHCKTLWLIIDTGGWHQKNGENSYWEWVRKGFRKSDAWSYSWKTSWEFTREAGNWWDERPKAFQAEDVALFFVGTWDTWD